jgi:ribosomal protein S24E
MEFETIEEKENVFFNRKDLKLNIKHPKSPTPKKSDLSKELAAKYSVPEDWIVIDYIFTKKGRNESFAKVKIYKEKPKIKVKEKKEEKSETQASEAK